MTGVPVRLRASQPNNFQGRTHLTAGVKSPATERRLGQGNDLTPVPTFALVGEPERARTLFRLCMTYLCRIMFVGLGLHSVR